MSDLVFGKYEIVRRLAAGGMGEVFLARQSGLGQRQVILKSLLPELAREPGFVTQFLDEARVVSVLNHPNVVSVFDVGQWNGTYFIAMEFIDGMTVAAIQREAAGLGVRVPPAVSAAIIHDAALGLAHAHAATSADGKPLAIVHRDVSPQNLMVRRDGVTKVLDFGIAWVADKQGRTATGVLKGKLAYMSPEQALGQRVAAASDQFALGVVLWELLTGKRLFRAVADLEVLKRVLDEPIVRPSLVRSDVPAELDAVVMRMLNRAPERRFASCAQVAAALEATLDGRTPTGESPVTLFLHGLERAPAPVDVGPAPGNFVVSFGEPGDDVGVATATVRPPALATPLGAASAPGPAVMKAGGSVAPRTPTSGYALASLLAGLTCCAPFSVVGIVTGLVALRDIERSRGELGGRGFALGGLALGGVGLVLALVAALVLRRW